MATRTARSATGAARRELGAAAVVTPAQAAILLGSGEAREWLEREGLIRKLPFGERVIWGDVIEALRRAPATRDPPPRPPAPSKPQWRVSDY